MTRQPIRINLEVESDAQPIQGSLRIQDQTPQPFWGWLQLSALLTGAVGCGDSAQGLPGRTAPGKD